MSPVVSSVIVGGSGLVAGVTDVVDDSAPSPALFTARSLISYSVPRDKPLDIVNDVDVLPTDTQDPVSIL